MRNYSTLPAERQPETWHLLLIWYLEPAPPPPKPLPPPQLRPLHSPAHLPPSRVPPPRPPHVPNEPLQHCVQVPTLPLPSWHTCRPLRCQLTPLPLSGAASVVHDALDVSPRRPVLALQGPTALLPCRVLHVPPSSVVEEAVVVMVVVEDDGEPVHEPLQSPLLLLDLLRLHAPIPAAARHPTWRRRPSRAHPSLESARGGGTGRRGVRLHYCSARRGVHNGFHPSRLSSPTVDALILISQCSDAFGLSFFQTPQPTRGLAAGAAAVCLLWPRPLFYVAEDHRILISQYNAFGISIIETHCFFCISTF